MPLTKSNAQFGINTKNGIDMYINEINNSGGINGRKLNVLNLMMKEILLKLFRDIAFLKTKMFRQ